MGVGNYIFWSEIGSGFGESGSTTPPRIPRSKPPPPGPSMELCWATVQATCRKQQTPQIWMEGGWVGQVYTVLLSKVTMSRQFYPWLQATIWTSPQNEWNHRTQFFFSRYHSTNFILLISLWPGNPDFISLLVSSGFLCQLQFRCVFLYCIIFWLNKNELNWIWSRSFVPSITCNLIT